MWDQVAGNVLVAILIAAASSWITIQLSLRQFRAEKWWERKMDAYTRVIEALHDSKAFSARSLEAASRGRDLPAGKENDLRRRAVAANDEILRATDVGGFLLSEEALSRLQQYQKDEERS